MLLSRPSFSRVKVLLDLTHLLRSHKWSIHSRTTLSDFILCLVFLHLITGLLLAMRWLGCHLLWCRSLTLSVYVSVYSFDQSLLLQLLLLCSSSNGTMRQGFLS
jgi:hypothetical protein